MRHPRTTRLLTLLPLASLGLALTACGVESDAPGVGDDNETGAEAAAGTGAGDCAGADGEYLIGMSQANVAEPYRQQMDDDIRAAVGEIPQFEVALADAAQDNAKQVSDVENFLTQGIDLLIISPNEAAPLTAVVERVYAEGIPVIVLDRKIESDSFTQWIGADNKEIGKAAGEYVANELLPDGGTVVEIKGLPGSTPAQERSDGFAEGIAGNDGVEIIATGVGDWLREKGQSQAEALFQANPEIDVVYAHNDPMAEGAYLAAQSAGREGEMEFIGIDGLPIPSGGIKAVEDGRLSATFIYPTGGREAVETAEKILIDCSTDVEKEWVLETQLVTADNAADVYTELGGQ
ncbi:substrate-binding domain-containing protein [Ornithinimicrobium cavernae]|uniref:substrate-binding domain-containing protein n=1 Tax=Ornithinimicrobium cavernae TaxID=2666047 RepID=UPI000D6A0445|nr:substrate-binding domain-containing protein [Ornithinimicrobium cavernae]